MATKTPKIIITDNLLGERELQGNELAEFLLSQEKMIAEMEATKAEAEAKANAKSALLERLGITEDEAKLLLS
jgi:hypothetical protein